MHFLHSLSFQSALTDAAKRAPRRGALAPPPFFRRGMCRSLPRPPVLPTTAPRRAARRPERWRRAVPGTVPGRRRVHGATRLSLPPPLGEPGTFLQYMLPNVGLGAQT